MSTFNRGHLKKLAKAGKLVMVGSHHFDDMHGETTSANVEIPVVYSPDGTYRQHGVLTLSDWDFKTKSGAAYIRPGSELIQLIVHSNCSYTLKVKD